MRSQKMGVVVCTCVLAGGGLVGETGTTIGADSRPIIVSDLETSYEVGTSNGGGGCVRDPAWICDGDTDGDGQVNPVDSGLVQAAFGSDDEAALCQYDVDCDGQINPVDSGIVQSLFGTCNAPRDSCGVGCSWDNNVIPDGFSGRAISPPSFPDMRVVDDVDIGGACEIITLRANIIEDSGWVPGEFITVYVYEDRRGQPGALMDSTDLTFTRTATGDNYFGRDDYDYFIEGVSITLPGGVSWIGMRNPNGSGAGTNYWMTSDGGPDGPGSDTGWFSPDGGNSFNPEGAGWHHAFEVTGGPEGSGACCLPDGSCTDDVPGSECFNAGGRFAIDTLCADIDPPCEEQTGRCCIFDENAECLVITATECRDRGGQFDGFATDCEDDPCGFAEGACCGFPDCLGTMRLAECEDLGGAWFEGETCPEFECPDVVGCGWDNSMIPNGFGGRAISPPNFPDIRVVDDIVVEQPGCTVLNFHANVLEDAAWTDGGMITVEVYEDTGDGPGTLLNSVDSEFTKIDTGDDYLGRDDYEYLVEGLAIDLPAGRSWIGIRNADGGGRGTNYWMTSDGGADGPGSETGWFSLDAGKTFNPEGAGWHHAFEIVP